MLLDEEDGKDEGLRFIPEVTSAKSLGSGGKLTVNLGCRVIKSTIYLAAAFRVIRSYLVSANIKDLPAPLRIESHNVPKRIIWCRSWGRLSVICVPHAMPQAAPRRPCWFGS